MFDNVLYQSACSLLSDDLKKNNLPPSILFSGPEASGKLTCALELARVLSCKAEDGHKGEWSCQCPSCLKHKALVSTSTLLIGPSERTLEISAARDTLLNEAYNSTTHVEASRYLYLRAVRKLTMRFNPVLWEGEDKLSKFSPLFAAIDEELEKLNPGRSLPENEELKEILDAVDKNVQKLEDSFLYKEIPVSQIRNCSAWAHLTNGGDRKIIIFENADAMNENARNALLKILEEPPEQTIFILTTSKRSSMLPTILSRVRTYSFFERPVKQQQTVISRVFHYTPGYTDTMPETIDEFLKRYLPVKQGTIKEQGRIFFTSIAEGHMPDLALISKNCNGFSPKTTFKIFLDGIIDAQKKLSSTAAGSECSFRILEELRNAYFNVDDLNQGIMNALESLSRNLMILNKQNDCVFKEAL